MEDNTRGFVPKEIVMGKANHDNLVGKYVLLWKKLGEEFFRVPVQVVGLDKSKDEVSFLVCGGVDKGKKFKGTYNPTQEVKVYDDGNVILAALQ